MLFGLLSFFFAFLMVFMILIILVQKGKGSLGIGNIGGGNQMLFGGSGGQDLFQKITWVLGVLLVFGSLGLAIWKTKIIGVSTSLLRRPKAPIERQIPAHQATQQEQDSE